MNKALTITESDVGAFGAFRDLRDLHGKRRSFWQRIFGPLLAITQAMCDSFKQQLLEAKHNFLASGGSNFYMALYWANATLSNATTVWTSTNETSGTGYTAGGAALTRINPATSGNVAYTDFADLTWTSATFVARGALIYNQSQSNAAVAVLDFGSDKSVTSGNFTVVFPTANATAAILRLA